MTKNLKYSQHSVCFQERPLVLAVRHALPYIVGLSLGLSMVQTASSRSSDSAAAFTATQLVRQFTLKNTVSQVSMGMQGYVAEVNGQQRAPAMGTRPADFPGDMGSVPATVNLPRRDGAGRPLGYCAWDNTATVSTADYNAGQGVATPLVYAVISPGLNGNMQTTCANVLATGAGVGDDHVQVAVASQVSSAQYKSSVATAGDLPAGEEGDVRLVRDTNKLYSYVGGTWLPVDGSKFSDDSATNGAGAISYTTGKVTVADFQATTATLTGALSGTSATFSGAVTANTFTGNGSGLTDLNASNFSSGVISPEFGGTGVNGAAAAEGALLIGNGSGFTLGTLTAGAGISVLNSAGAITIGNTGVVSITGTADQIITSANNGNVVLSLPQAIATTSTPTFGGLMLNGDLIGTNATFSGSVIVGSLAAQRLDIGTFAGGVNNPNMIVGTGALAGTQSGNGGNTALGISVLGVNTTGFENTGVGLNVLASNTTGAWNTAVGSLALVENTFGGDNTALGWRALGSNTTGGLNTAVGSGALQSNITGEGNVSVGFYSGNANIGGDYNTFLGDRADATVGSLSFATALGSDSRVATSDTLALGRTTTDQVVIGTDSRNDTYANTRLYVNGVTNLNGDLQGTTATFSGAVTMGSLTTQRLDVSTSAGGVSTPNVIVGTDAMPGTQSGSGANTALGLNALYSNSTGYENVAVGWDSLYSNTAGNLNTAVGSSALYSNSTGSLNTAMGRNAMVFNSTGSENTAFGVGALYENDSGNQNTAMGRGALFFNTTGQFNVALGNWAGDENITGSNNTFIGSYSDATSNGLNYATAIGSDSSVATSDTLALGRNSMADQVVIGTDSRNDTFANTKLYVNGVTNLNGDLQGTTATFSGAVTMNSLTAQRLDVGTSAGGVTNPNLIVGLSAMGGSAQSGNGGNTVLGINGLYNNTTGFENTGVGLNVLASNTTGAWNTAVGSLALVENTFGGDNTALGWRALGSNTTGGLNTAVGSGALQSNITGEGNVSVGFYSGNANIGGDYNTFLGDRADATVGSLSFATALGSDSRVATSDTLALGRTTTDQVVIGTDSRNDTYANTRLYVNGVTNLNGDLQGTTATFSGAVTMGSLTAQRLDVTTSAGGVTNPNLIIGSSAMPGAQTGGGGNSAIGISALAANTEGRYNTATGYRVLESNTTGIRNTAVGALSMRLNTTGTGNTTMGVSSLEFSTTGTDNVALGDYNLFNNTTGNRNTSVGAGAGATNTTGSNNTFIGNNANVSTGELSYATAIGADSSVATSNTLALGRTTTDQVVIGTASRNDSFANTRLYVNGVTNLNGDLRGTTATFSGGVTVDSLTALRLDVGTSAGGVTRTNVIIGIGAMPGVQSGSGANVAIGINALQSNSTGSSNVAIGHSSLQLNTAGIDNIAIGRNTLTANTTGNNNVAVGRGGLFKNTTGSGNVSVGKDVLFNATTGANNSAFGHTSMYNTSTGYSNAAFGAITLHANTTGYRNAALGEETLQANTTGFQNVGLGYRAGEANTTGNNNTFLGSQADAITGALTYATAIGSDSRVATSNTLALGRNSTVDQVVIGTHARDDTFAGTKLYVNGITNLNGDLRGTTANFTGAVTMGSLTAQRLDVGTSAGGVTNPNTIVGLTAMPSAQSGAGGNTAVGYSSLNQNTSGANNTALGRNSLRDNTTASSNTAVGNNAMLQNETGGNNTAMGADALRNNVSGADNTVVGNLAMNTNTTGSFNVAMGSTALFDNSDGTYSVALGYDSLRRNTSGIRNTGVGNRALYDNITGNLNTALGNAADVNATNLNYATAIGAHARVTTSNTLVLGALAGAKHAAYSTTDDQVVIGSNSRNDTHVNTKLYVNGTAAVGGLVSGQSIRAASYDAVNMQGGYLQWNRDSTSGITYLINQKGTGGGGISFGESTTGNVYTQGMFLSAAGNLNVAGSLEMPTNQVLRFGSDGESTDLVGMYRFSYGLDKTALRVIIADNNDTFGGIYADEFQVGSANPGKHLGFSPKFRIAGSGDVIANGYVQATAFNVSSDRRLKTDISQQDTDSVLDLLGKVNTYSYRYIANPNIGRRIGVIAQELQVLFPEAVATRADGMLSVDYNALGAMAAVGVGQLNNKFVALDKTVTEQGQKLTELDDKVVKHNTRIEALEGWKTEAVNRMDGMQTAIDVNIQKIAENAVAIQTNAKSIERLDDALLTLDGTVKGNTDAIANINSRWARNFSASEDGSLLTVNAVELKVSNFTAQQMRANSVYTQRLEAEIARIADLEVNNLRANSAVANTVQAEQVNTGSVQVYAGAGLPALLFAAKADGHYTVSTSSLDGSYATATVIVNAGQAKVVSVSSEGIELVAEGNMVKAIAAGKSIKASWIKMG